jgi:tRNA threonylcarbamoyladenosine biosynthesis protein TsaE
MLGDLPTSSALRFSLPDAAATEALGRWLAGGLGKGDVLLLSGPVGAGKTHLARALILARLDRPEDVPSPSYTLVQTYQAPGLEIWHADLYRLRGADDCEELGLTDAFDTALCLIEWPDRLGVLRPEWALELTLSMVAEGREAVLTGPIERLEQLSATGARP